MDCVSKGVDYKGKTVGSYIVLGFDRIHTCPSGQYKKYWKVRCIHCMNEKSISIQHVIHSHQEGCSSCKKVRFAGVNNHNWHDQYQYVTGMYFGKTKHSAEKRNLEFSITRKQMEQKYIDQGKKCIYTGFDIHFGSKEHRPTASIDRIVSSIGYTLNNIQWVHKDVNHMKMDMSHEDFIEICKQITENYKK